MIAIFVFTFRLNFNINLLDQNNNSNKDLPMLVPILSYIQKSSLTRHLSDLHYIKYPPSEKFKNFEVKRTERGLTFELWFESKSERRLGESKLTEECSTSRSNFFNKYFLSCTTLSCDHKNNDRTDVRYIDEKDNHRYISIIR